ncbi:MAG: ferritin-like domain-containing protein, partial [Proteobacteria bacterium]|nr:ferritin-like domain-containing protein [Pseudomonadota bacterium]
RGAAIEAGGSPTLFSLDRKIEVWADQAPRLYAQAAAHQWDPQTAIDWNAPIGHDDVIEDAVVRVMAYLIENEEAALVVPARFLGRVHPHFREIQQVLAIQVADEARHIEVFTRRANLRRPMRALSTVGGRRSLQTLLEEPDFAVATFLLSVLGEGTFLSLLAFLERHAPDPVTRQIAHLTRQDEARHVAFSMAHLERLLTLEPSWRARLAASVERRHDALASTAGLNEEVFDALVLLSAGSIRPADITVGWNRVQTLQREMHESRRMRLSRLGFATDEAERLSGLHTRNFM